MNKQYVNSTQDEKKFGGSGSGEGAEVNKDPEFLNYQEERANTMKMSTILKNLNSPKKKRKAIEALRQARAQEEQMKKTQRSKSKKFVSKSQAVPLSHMMEDD